MKATLLALLSLVPLTLLAREGEVVHRFQGPMPTGVTVSADGRIFVNFPRWGDRVPHTVVELREGREVPYPNAAIQRPNEAFPMESLVSVQSVVVDPRNRLWILDTGRPGFRPPSFGGPKLVGVDLAGNRVFKRILFPPDVVLPETYLNDVRFDLRRGAQGTAFITDSAAEGAIIVVDLGSGRSWRRLHGHPSTSADASFDPRIEGKPLRRSTPGGGSEPVRVGADGIAISADGERLYYCPLTSNRLYSVSIDALINRDRSDSDVAATVIDHGLKPPADGLESDAQSMVYITDYVGHAVHRGPAGGPYEVVLQGQPKEWPDTLSLSGNGWLYVIMNQLHLQPSFHGGQDLRRKPYTLQRVRVSGNPVNLRSLAPR